MSEETKFGSCSPSDCATCGGCSTGKPTDPSEIPSTLSLTLEDDTEIECAIITVFPVESTEYIALLPLDENGQNTDGEVFLYQFSRMEDGSPMLANIENDDEYVKAAEVFNEIVERARAAELAGEPLE